MGCNSSKGVDQKAGADVKKPQDISQATVDGGENGSAADLSSVLATKPPPSKELDFKLIHSAFRWNRSLAEVEALCVSPEAINSVDKGNGNRPIHIAAQNGHSDLIELLIRKKVELDAQNMKGNTGLHMAIGYDYFETAQLLIAAGASLEIVNETGVAAKYGLEGDKCLGIAALIAAKSPEDANSAFDMCETVIENLNRINFAQAGLKAKKQLGEAWSAELQDRFKSITNRLA